MEVKQWTYEELPEFTDIPEGAKIIPTTGDEVGVMYLHDIEYANVDGHPLHLQLMIPNSRNKRMDFFVKELPFKLPCFVFVQGSAWMQQYVYANVPNLSKLAARGYVCAIVEYRHSGIAKFPSQAEDALNAVRFLRKNAPRFGIDQDNM
ncbi:MAG: alpha/beta hydrolase fold domain-containing protein, partial [Lachnospiraceae bacterium]|nr:alpha/beta hydrolase fold domain-containing protein [Lachnospiraceae bacterium]